MTTPGLHTPLWPWDEFALSSGPLRTPYGQGGGGKTEQISCLFLTVVGMLGDMGLGSLVI